MIHSPDLHTHHERLRVGLRMTLDVRLAVVRVFGRAPERLDHDRRQRTLAVGAGPPARRSPPRDLIQGSTAAGPARFVGASQPVAAGTTLQRFAGAENPFTCAPGDQLPKPLTIDGAAAVVTLDGCPSKAELGGLIWDVVVIKGGRGYDFTIDSGIGASDAGVWLASIQLDPASART